MQTFNLCGVLKAGFRQRCGVSMNMYVNGGWNVLAAAKQTTGGDRKKNVSSCV